MKGWGVADLGPVARRLSFRAVFRPEGFLAGEGAKGLEPWAGGPAGSDAQDSAETGKPFFSKAWLPAMRGGENKLGTVGTLGTPLL